MHTPGPWRQDRDYVMGPDNQVIAVCRTLEPVANARLIAAAPALLKACEKAEELIASFCSDHADPRPTDVTVCLPELQAAIAKAKRNQ